jgi:hypothetical protein
MIDFTTPEHALREYDAVEVAGCVEEYGSIERISSVDQRTPMFWSVYLHKPEEGSQCIADFDDQGSAELFGTFMRGLIMGERE